MKKKLRSIFAELLAMSARAVLRKYKPKVVMVTGSVGKTSTKDAVTAVLAHRFFVRGSEKSYNSEFGVPLTIIGAANPWARPVAWVRVFGEVLMLLLLPNHYPKILILEVGADSPGDLARILKIATPDVVVVTRLPEMPVHVEAYATPAAVREEEFSPAYALVPGAPLIVSADDSFARELAAPLSVQLSTYGFAEEAQVRIVREEPWIETGRVVGIIGTVSLDGSEYRIPVRGALGRPQLLAPTAAMAVARALGMTVAEAVKGAERYSPPAGRGRLIDGLHNSVLLDDSYNASPAAVREALASLTQLSQLMPGSRRIAALGDMMELGRYSQQEHEAIGTEVARCADVLVAVGSRSRATADAARAAGIPDEAVHTFANSVEAAEFLRGNVQQHDIILVKGSQSVRMERIAEALLQHPNDRAHLVRQDREWKRR